MQVKQVKQVSKNIYIHYIIKIVKGFLLVCALPQNLVPSARRQKVKEPMTVSHGSSLPC